MRRKLFHVLIVVDPQNEHQFGCSLARGRAVALCSANVTTVRYICVAWRSASTMRALSPMHRTFLGLPRDDLITMEVTA